METFTFDNTTSSAYGLIISEKNIYSAPARAMEFVSVPGRNGDVIIDQNRFENINVSYTVGCKDIKNKAKSIKTWLCKSGYFRLTDSYQPLYFRMAAFASKLDISELINNVGQANLIFNCKPFMYSFAGQNKTTLTSSGTITNPESYDSQPYIKITGSGSVTLTINSKAYLINSISSYIELDSELMSAYKGSTLCNDKIGFTEFPILTPGSNSISWTGSVTKVEIIPRWRT
ncbi:MAG: phage tail family protein, partial [Clostridia bacterium]|nr:phage tail family protein [Clostridia bacterium]